MCMEMPNTQTTENRFEKIDLFFFDPFLKRFSAAEIENYYFLNSKWNQQKSQKRRSDIDNEKYANSAIVLVIRLAHINHISTWQTHT